MTTITKTIALNRVEGDLTLELALDSDGVVESARSIGTLYRGIENLLIGRGPLDGLVITPRICGICTTAHLNAAAKALDMAFGVTIPDNAHRLRNVTLLVEHLQNDIRQTFLLFMPDLVNEQYQDQPMYDKAHRRYAALAGTAVTEAVEESRRLLEIIAILGGQWPHSSFMVPGGVVTVPSAMDITQCRYILQRFKRWVVHRMFGCRLDRWLSVVSVADLTTWLDERPDHRQSHVGFLLDYGRAIGLDRLGSGHNRWISYGGPEMPAQTSVTGLDGGDLFFPAGMHADGKTIPLDAGAIAEDVTSSHYSGDMAPLHPFDGVTLPAEDDSSQRYSWAKAPRYAGKPAETGPLADAMVAGDPLFRSLVTEWGASALVRQLARMVRSVYLIPVVDQWLAELMDDDGPYFMQYPKRPVADGFGLANAPRGALGHWVRFEEGRIANYQVITPTAWNGSPRDRDGTAGPWEAAVTGVRVQDPQICLEAAHVVRSFDPCLVCTVHCVDTENPL